MVTRLGRAVSYLGIGPSLFMIANVCDESSALGRCCCRQLNLVAALDVRVRQGSRSQGVSSRQSISRSASDTPSINRLTSESSLRVTTQTNDGGNSFHTSSSPRSVRASSWRWNDEEIAEDALGVSFKEGVKLFNAGEYYRCHDVLESLWNDAREPQRSILHGILQCAVGLYHLLHQNHRGAMVELGEGLTKLRRVGLNSGPLHDFERETSAVLEFIYNTQLEHAACSDDICITMDGSEQSYRLLGNFGAGQVLYKVAEEADGLHIHFVSQRPGIISEEFAALSPARVKVPFYKQKTKT